MVLGEQFLGGLGVLRGWEPEMNRLEGRERLSDLLRVNEFIPL